MTESPKTTRTPLPMAWVVIAIVTFMSIYTAVNVVFRKEEKPHVPYEEAQERASRFFEFDMNGWMGIEATPSTGQAIPLRFPLTVSSRPLKGRLDQALPMDLVTVIPRRPNLVDRIHSVEVDQSENRLMNLHLLPDRKSTGAIELDAFVKEGQFIILAIKGRGDRETVGTVTFSLTLQEEAFPPGDYNAGLYTDENVYEWAFTIE